MDQGTFFISAETAGRKLILQADRMAGLLVDVLYSYRAQNKYFLNEFVIMPDHFHLLITPKGETTLEKSMQLIKGGFSFRAKKELEFRGEVWQKSFYDRRMRDAHEYDVRKQYIHQNPVKAGLVAIAEKWEWGSASGKYERDPYLSG